MIMNGRSRAQARITPAGPRLRPEALPLEMTAEMLAGSPGVSETLERVALAGRRALGADPGDLPPARSAGPHRNSAHDLVHPDDRSAGSAVLTELMTGERDQYEIPHRIVRPDGAIRHIVSRGEVIDRDDEGIRRAGGMLQDVDRERAVRT